MGGHGPLRQTPKSAHIFPVLLMIILPRLKPVKSAPCKLVWIKVNV